MNLSRQWLVYCVAQLTKAMGYLPYLWFQEALRNPMLSQNRVFKKRICELSKTEYGQYYGITNTSTYKEFASKIPIQDYDGIAPWITRQLENNQSIITPHRIIHIEPTSGSSGKAKRIPFTQSLMGAFSKMFCIWSYDHLSNGLRPKTGKIFISVSPEVNTGSLNDDSEFLREPLRSLLKPFLILPPKTKDKSIFQYELSVTLLKTKDLEVISVWSPSYLLVLLDYIEQNRYRLKEYLPTQMRDSGDIEWELIWPDLKLISCWNNALAEPLAQRLRQLFPNTLIQGKGLLATEAPLTLPLNDANGCVPLLQDIFFEFELETGQIKLLHELNDGDQAQVILTQSAGLTRYRLHDVVKVDGWYHQTPKLVFMGRDSQVCDLAGEKLNETFVRNALLPLLPAGHFILLPVTGKEMGYALITEVSPVSLAQKADEALCGAYHYKYARSIGQLQPLQVYAVDNFLPQLLAFQQSEGLKLGNVKDVALIVDPEKGKRLLAFFNLMPGTSQQPRLLA